MPSFNIAPASRSGSFQTNPVVYAGNGSGILNATLPGLGTGPGSDYENTANFCTMQLFVDPSGGNNFIEYDMFTWKGGPVSYPDKGITDPTPVEQYPYANVLPVGSNFFIKCLLPSTPMNIGISGTF